MSNNINNPTTAADHDPTEHGPHFVPEEYRGDGNPFVKHSSHEECIEANAYGDPADTRHYHPNRPLVGQATRCMVCYRSRVRYYDQTGELREVRYNTFLGETEAVEQVD